MKYLYMDEQERQIQYYQFPKFLLELPLSQNARIIYMLLYDRARISRKNNWADEDGRVYAVFPIDELSQKTGKCKSSVKKALKELDDTILNDLCAIEDKIEYIRLLDRYELLIIDDLGVERSSEYALENIFSVIDWRYRSGRPLIITTNLPLVQLKQETKIEKKRIYDRILERCIPVKIDGVSRREAMANDNMQTMKNILKI